MHAWSKRINALKVWLHIKVLSIALKTNVGSHFFGLCVSESTNSIVLEYFSLVQC